METHRVSASVSDQGHPRRNLLGTCGARPKIEGGGGQGIQYLVLVLVSLQWPVVQLDFSDGMHMSEKSYGICLRARACARKYRQIQAILEVRDSVCMGSTSQKSTGGGRT
eukprot:COSAG05_NODE_23_length_31591_cov_92.542995_25_plen_110_part_00